MLPWWTTGGMDLLVAVLGTPEYSDASVCAVSPLVLSRHQVLLSSVS